MKIRKAKKEDINFIYKTGIKEKWFQTREGKFIFWSKFQLLKWIEGKRDVLLISEKDGKAIGYIMSTFHEPTGKATIENIYVSQESRGKGIAFSLVKECLKQLKFKGCTYAVCMISSTNKAIKELMKASKFKEGYKFYWIEKTL